MISKEEDFYNRGLASAQKGDYDLAIEEYSQAIKLNRNFTLAYNNRGAAYAQQGKYDPAIKDFNKAITLNPNVAEAYLNRANAYANKSVVFTDEPSNLSTGPYGFIIHNPDGLKMTIPISGQMTSAK